MHVSYVLHLPGLFLNFVLLYWLFAVETKNTFEIGEDTDNKVVPSDSEEHEGMLIYIVNIATCMFGMCNVYIVRSLISRFSIIIIIILLINICCRNET